MDTRPVVTTARLILRPFGQEHFDAFATLDADPIVREFFPSVLTREESHASGMGYIEHWAQHGFGRWAIAIPGVTQFAGIAGLMQVPFTTAFTPAVEVGWRLAPEYWGHGFASEAARASCDFGFETLGLSEIVAFTVPANTRSRRVMERIGMTYHPEETFQHPLIGEGNPLRTHVLYRLGPKQRERFDRDLPHAPSQGDADDRPRDEELRR